MNERQLALCSSAEWGDAVNRWIVPWALEDVDLGDEVLEIGPWPGLTTGAVPARPIPRVAGYLCEWREISRH